jgi:hypothetical protein
MSLKDFLLALATEVNDIGVEREVLKRALQGGAERVLSEMKAQTKYVVT